MLLLLLLLLLRPAIPTLVVVTIIEVIQKSLDLFLHILQFTVHILLNTADTSHDLVDGGRPLAPIGPVGSISLLLGACIH